MKRIFNSLQFQQYAAYALVILFLAAAFFALAQFNRNDFRQEQNITAQLRTSTYYLSSVARRLVESQTDAEAQSVRGLLNDAIANFEKNREQLREGDRTGTFDGIKYPEILPLLDEVDRHWTSYREVLQQVLVADLSVAYETLEPLLRKVDQESVAVYAYADRIVAAIGALEVRATDDFQATFTVLLALTVVALTYAGLVTVRSVRGIARLKMIADNFAAGRLEKQTQVKSFDEISQVGGVLNDMASRVSSLITDLENSVKEAVQARLKAEQSDKVKSSFLASMSHELRTPLNAIINFTSFVVDGDLGPVNDQQQGILKDVVSSATHLLNLINDVLDMSKIESGSLNLFIEENVDLVGIVNSAISTAKGLLGDKPVRLETEIATDLPDIAADRQRVLQILLNIVSNACKFTQQGSIHISVQQKFGELIMSVADTGAGISNEDRAAVFQAFKQTESGLRQGSGTGLGMPITKSLVEAHGGRIWFDSQPGQGSTFYVSLPIKAQYTVPAQAA